MCFSREISSEYPALQDELNQYFSISNSERFPSYPFSNDMFYSEILNSLRLIKPSAHKSKAALLVGESNLLSMLPELVLHAGIVLLVDIQSKIHQHTRHLLDC